MNLEPYNTFLYSCTHKCRRACSWACMKWDDYFTSCMRWPGVNMPPQMRDDYSLHAALSLVGERASSACHKVILSILLTCTGKQLMCINWICNNYGHLVSDLVTRLNLCTLMWCWSMADSFCRLAQVSSYYIIEMRVPFYSVSSV